jgi:hypothetical protein
MKGGPVFEFFVSHEPFHRMGVFRVRKPVQAFSLESR